MHVNVYLPTFKYHKDQPHVGKYTKHGSYMFFYFVGGVDPCEFWLGCMPFSHARSEQIPHIIGEKQTH